MPYESEWKKQKPKTLLKETLSPALAELDKVQTAAGKVPATSSFSAISGAAKNAKRVAEAQLKALNPTLHKDSIAWMKKLIDRLSAEVKAIEDQQKRWNVFVGEVKTKKQAVIAAFEAVIHQPKPDTVGAAKKQVADFMTWFNSDDRASSLETDTAKKWAGAASPTLEDIGAIVAKKYPAESKERQEAMALLINKLRDLKEATTKLGKLGGFEPPKNMFATRALG